MKKIIVFLLLVVAGVMSGSAETSYEYVKYGGGLELIVRSESHWVADDTKTYGLRKNGMELISAKYKGEDACLIDELSLLVFMRDDERDVRIYDIKTGKEVLHHKGSVDCSGYQLKTKVIDGQKQWQIVETAIPDSFRPAVKKVVARFCLENGKVYQLVQPKTVYTKKEI